MVGELAQAVAAAEPGAVPTVPDPAVPVVQVTGTNGKTTTVRLLAHIVEAAGLRVAYSSTDGVYAGDRRVRRGDYSGFGGAGLALRTRPDVAVLETARGGILLRGIGVLHNDVAVVTNVSADHLGLHGIDTVDQLAEVKATITRITRPAGWDVLNADDPRVLAMRRHATGRIWVWSLDPAHPAIRETLAEHGRATTVVDGRISWLEGQALHPVVALADVPVTIAGLSSIFTANALAAASAALAVGLPATAVARGLRTFVPDQERNPGRANLFALEGRTIVIDYAHNEAGMLGLTEILGGLRPRGAEVWLAICTAGDRTDEIMHGFGFRAAVGADHLGIADLRHYTRGRTAQQVYDRLAAAAATAGVEDPPRYRGRTARAPAHAGGVAATGRDRGDRARHAAAAVPVAGGAGGAPAHAGRREAPRTGRGALTRLSRARPTGRRRAPGPACRRARPGSIDRRTTSSVSGARFSAPSSNHIAPAARSIAGKVSVMRRRPWYSPGHRHVAIGHVQDRIARHERGGVAVGTDPEVQQVEPGGQRGRVGGRGGLGVGGRHVHRMPRRGGRGREERVPEVRHRPVGVAVGRDALVHLEQIDVRPWNLHPGEHSNIRHGVEPPEAANANRRPAAAHDRAASAITSAPRRAAPSASSKTSIRNVTPASPRGRRTGCASPRAAGRRSPPVLGRRTARTAPR